MGYKQGAVTPNEHGDHLFKFQNLSSYNTSKQMAKFDKKLSADSISAEGP